MSMNYAPKTFAYIVRPGDTLRDLAKCYDTTAEMIFAVNPGITPNNLIAGQVITMPGDPPSRRGPEFIERRRAELERRRRLELERRRRAELERRRREKLGRKRRSR